MVRLIEDYEERHHPLPDPGPRKMLVYLMEQRGLKQADLVPIFKSRGYVSDAVSGSFFCLRETNPNGTRQNPALGIRPDMCPKIGRSGAASHAEGCAWAD